MISVISMWSMNGNGFIFFINFDLFVFIIVRDVLI